MSFLWKAIGLSGDTIPNFPFAVVKAAASESDAAGGADGENTHGDGTSSSAGGSSDVTYSTAVMRWRIQNGERDEDKLHVSIFSVKLSECTEAQKELVRNVVKRAKSMTLLPGVLRCYGATEYNEVAYVATERCVPLTHVLENTRENKKYYENEDKYCSSVAYGLKNVGKALLALHRNNLFHGNVTRKSIYVNSKSGEWKLFGFELISAIGDDSSVFAKQATSLLPPYRQPPELTQSAAAAGNALQSPIDAWGLGCLVYEALGKTTAAGGIGAPTEQELNDVKANTLRTCRGLPSGLQSSFLHLVSLNPKQRYTVDTFISECPFISGNEFVRCMDQLDELSLLDAPGRDLYFTHLSSVIDSFPLPYCQHVILGKLHGSLQYSACAAVLEPVLRIGARLKDKEVYARTIGPTVVALFTSTDRILRLYLLQRASEYAPLLPSQLVNETIWPLFVTGFSHPIASIREHTVRALVHFAPLLSEKILTADVPKCIAQVQQDREGALRTNATICLSLIAKYFPEQQRSKFLVHGFGRMLKDPFLPSRTAALRSMESCLQYMTPQSIAEMIIPGVGPLTMDPFKEAREPALNIMRAALARLQAYHQNEAPPDPVQPGTTPTPQQNAAATAAAPTSSATSVASSWLGGWMSSSTPAAASTAPSPSPPPTSKPAAEQQQPQQKTSSGAFSTGGVKAAMESAAAAAAAEDFGGWDDSDGFDDDDDDKPAIKPLETKRVSATSASASSASSLGALKEKPTSSSSVKLSVSHADPVGATSALPSAHQETAQETQFKVVALKKKDDTADSVTSSKNLSASRGAPIASGDDVASLNATTGTTGSTLGLGKSGGPTKLRKKGGLGATKIA